LKDAGLAGTTAASGQSSPVFSELQSSKLELVDGTKVAGYAPHSVSLLFVVELVQGFELTHAFFARCSTDLFRISMSSISMAQIEIYGAWSCHPMSVDFGYYHL
jgi:hypothetical protein